MTGQLTESLTGRKRGQVLQKAVSGLFTQTSVYSIVVVRIAMGIFVMWQAYNKGVRVFAGYRAAEYQFSYPFFEWVPVWPEWATYIAIAWFISGLMVAVGLFYRVSAVFCFLLTLWAYVIPADLYLNHEYMELIFLFLIIFMPAHYRFSVDSLLHSFPATAPKLHLTVLRVQTEIILVYAGLVKVNSDWLQLQPLSNWLQVAKERVFFGGIWEHWLPVAVGAYGIILLHIFGAPLLFFKKTRLAVFILYSGFHIINSLIFPIDIFPWMTIACTTLFFDPDWPLQVWRRISGGTAPIVQSVGHHPATAALTSGRFIALVAAGLWLLSQAVIPSRHLLYPGWVDWNDAGTRFSWRMMLAQRQCPVFRFVLSSPDRARVVIPDLPHLLKSERHTRHNLCVDGDLILQTAKQTKDVYVKAGVIGPEAEIRAHIMRSLNYREPALMVDPTFNLSKQERTWFTRYAWLTNGETLPELPAPFESNLAKSKEPDLVATGLIAGFDLLRDYECKFERPPVRKDGNDVVCVRK
jgi:vitamin K-dependent gamma-carboxylase